MRIRLGGRGVVLAMMVLGTVVACGNSDDSSDGSDGGGGGGGNSGGTCTAPTDQCTLITTSEAATALGAESATTTPGLMAPGDPSVGVAASGSCSYSGYAEADPVGNAIAVGYECGLQAELVANEPQAVKTIIASGLAVSVSGVGDLAYWATSGSYGNGTDSGLVGGGTLTAYFGDNQVTVVLIGDGADADLEARAATVAKLAISRL